MSAPAIAPAFIPASVKRRKNTWYTTSDGNWTNPAIWESNAVKRWNYPGQNIAAPIFPQVGDDVFISHSVTFNGALNLTINNLYVSGALLCDNTGVKTLNIKGDVQAVGSINLTSTQVVNFNVEGVNNYITSFTAGSNSIFGYVREGDQNVLPLSYANLKVSGIATKYLISNLTLAAGLSYGTNGSLQLGSYDFTVGASCLLNGINSSLLKSGSGNIVFSGILGLGAQTGSRLDFSAGNPTVQLYGGINNSGNGLAVFNTGTGLWTFTTNNQAIAGANILAFACPILISGAITLSINAQTYPGTSMDVTFNNTVNGDNVASTLVNKSIISVGTSSYPMATGVFIPDTFTSTLRLSYNGASTIPYTSFSTLQLTGTGIKNLSGNTTCSVAITINGSSALECSTYNLTTAIFTCTGSFSKSGGGNIVTTGLVTFSFGTLLSVALTGNPTWEFKAGLALGNTSAGFTGAANFIFSINSQTISVSGAVTHTLPYNILISGAITVTKDANGTLVQQGTINGDDPASTFDNRGTVQYQNATRPMITGVLQTNAAANTWMYNKAGAQDITGGTYRILTLAGSGVKTLQGNVVVATTYTLTGPATLNLNGFTRT